MQAIEALGCGLGATPAPRATQTILRPWPRVLVPLIETQFGDTWAALRVADGRKLLHQGVDLAAVLGTPVRAAAPGIVTAAHYKSGRLGSREGADPTAGNWVQIEHTGPWRGFTTRYLHLTPGRGGVQVKKGDRVGMGDVIGKTGDSGKSVGPHLHFDMGAKQVKLIEVRPAVGRRVGREVAGGFRLIPSELFMDLQDTPFQIALRAAVYLGTYAALSPLPGAPRV